MTDKEMIEKAKRYYLDLEILNVIKIDNKTYFEVICPHCGQKRDRLSTLSAIKKHTVSCNECRKKLIKQTKNSKVVPYENSFEGTDNFNRVQYWDYNKNIKKPSEITQGTRSKYWFNCENGHSFQSSISDVNTKGNWCPICASFLKESKMAVALKQVLRHEFPNTIWEYDAGFKGTKGGKSRYDIYVPELNLLIECQSEYHDSKIELDKLKKQYAILNGYDFVAIDYRSGKIETILKCFFPNIKEIPDYVSFMKNTKVD